MAEPAAAPSHSPDDTDDDAEFSAIRDALQESARGRRFLAEFSRRQRNADTLMVLDAVARIEARLAVQPPAPAPDTDDALVADLAAIIGEGRTLLAVPSGATDPGPARAALQAIRDISWTLRECGADARICDLLDRQAAVAEAGLAAPGGAAGKTLAILDRLAARIGGGAPRTPPDAVSPAPAGGPREADAAAPADANAEPARPSPAIPLAHREPKPEPKPEPVSVPAPLAETGPAAGASAATLGAALLADGVVVAPPRADPLAAFLRMTQAEKLAFFS